jgi:NitT/TauT family transport system substrate-binding protein
VPQAYDFSGIGWAKGGTMQRLARPIIAILSFAALILAGVGSPLRGQADDVLHVGIVNSSTDVSFFIADANGYFRDEGLQVDFVPFAAAAKMVPVLGTGELAAGGGAVSAGLYNAVERGVEMKVVADKAHHDPDSSHAALLVRKDLIASGRFKSFADLRGLKVALSGKGTSDESVLNEALRLGGLHWGDCEVVYMGFPQHPAAFANGAIDASLTAEPALTNTLKTGSVVLYSRIGQFYPHQQSASVIYGVKLLKQEPDKAQRFMRAYVRGARFYNDAIVNGALTGRTAPQVIEILTKYAPVKDPAVYRVITPPAISPDGSLYLASMQKDWQFFKDTGQISGRVTVDQIVDLSFVNAAVAGLGPYHRAAPDGQQAQ